MHWGFESGPCCFGSVLPKQGRSPSLPNNPAGDQGDTT